MRVEKDEEIRVFREFIYFDTNFTFTLFFMPFAYSRRQIY